MQAGASKQKLVLEVDAETRTVIRVDEELEAVLGYGRGELPGRPVSELPGHERAGAALASFPQLFRDVAHDVVAPMNQVSTLVALLVRRHQAVLTDEGSSELLEHIQTAVQRMKVMSGGLRTVSRMLGDAPSPEFIQSEELLATALHNCHRLIETAHASIEYGDLPIIFADAQRITYVFQELIENAIRFRGAEPLRIRIGATERGSDWLFTVRDNGSGFDARSAEEVFRIFRRAHPEYQSSQGVGLTICREVIVQHGGRMWAESERGEGTSVCFTLPRVSTADRSKAGEEHPDHD